MHRLSVTRAKAHNPPETPQIDMEETGHTLGRTLAQLLYGRAYTLAIQWGAGNFTTLLCVMFPYQGLIYCHHQESTPTTW